MERLLSWCKCFKRPLFVPYAPHIMSYYAESVEVMVTAWCSAGATRDRRFLTEMGHIGLVPGLVPTRQWPWHLGNIKGRLLSTMYLILKPIQHPTSCWFVCFSMPMDVCWQCVWSWLFYIFFSNVICCTQMHLPQGVRFSCKQDCLLLSMRFQCTLQAPGRLLSYQLLTIPHVDQLLCNTLA